MVATPKEKKRNKNVPANSPQAALKRGRGERAQYRRVRHHEVEHQLT
jgi:hypothetical protein